MHRIATACAASLSLVAAANAQLSLTTQFTGELTFLAGSNAGVLIDVTALHPGGITIESFDVHSYSNAGVAISVSVYHKQGSWETFNTSAGAWTLLGTVPGVSAGMGQPTPIALGGLTIPGGQTYGLYIHHNTGGVRYNTAAGTIPVWENSDLKIVTGATQNALFGGAFYQPRGWNGTIYYSPAGSPPCYGNCDGSTVEPVLNVDDFTCFINEFASASSLPFEQQVTHYANCDGSTIAPALNVDDFTCFINAFAQGCR
jgi:hypothetical protein